MWSHAVFALRISPDLFWQLTPRQYSLLCDRHRDALIHLEMIGAFTTAAVVNFSLASPEKPVAPSEWMPNYRPTLTESKPKATPQERAENAAFDGRRTQLTAELKAYAETGVVGPTLRQMGYSDKV